jgi:hypothetical protein
VAKALALKLAAVKAKTKAEKCFMGSFPERGEQKMARLWPAPSDMGTIF